MARARFDVGSVQLLANRTGEPEWLRAVRFEAFSRFEVLPWPETTTEEWRHTDLRGLDLVDFDGVPAPNEQVRTLDELPAEVRALIGEHSGVSVQMDADTIYSELEPDLARQGVVFAPLGHAGHSHQYILEREIGRAGVSDHELKLSTLAAAFTSGGTFIFVPRGVSVHKPLEAIRYMTRGSAAMCPRVVIVADEGAEVTFIDRYAGSGIDSPSLCVALVEIYAHPGSSIDYLAMQDWPPNVWHFNIQRALIERDATVRSLAASFGAKLSRSVVESILDGEGAHAEMLGLYFGDGDQHIDNRTLQLHRAPHTTSKVYYKGALKGTSRAIYSGLVDLEKEAAKADAQQENRNLLLSQGASAAPTPFLEIKTSEVSRATHGVSVGRPEDDVLFYLRSRGLDERAAERVYVQGFFQQAIDRVRVPEVRASLESAVEAELEVEG